MTPPSTIYPAKYRRGIDALLGSVGLPNCLFLIEPSVQDWARGVGVKVDSPFLSGMALRRSDGVPTIVLLEEIDHHIQRSILPAMEIRGFTEEIEQLQNVHLFLEHLVLHEAAHLLLPSGASESECDAWAFGRLTGSLQPDAT